MTPVPFHDQWQLMSDSQRRVLDAVGDDLRCADGAQRHANILSWYQITAGEQMKWRELAAVALRAVLRHGNVEVSA